MPRSVSVWALLLCSIAAWAQPYGRPVGLRGVGIDQKLNGQVPLDLRFHDETGNTVRLGDFITGRRPVVLSLVYYRCPMLCNLVLNGEMRSFRQLPLDLGKDFDAITVSFDPNETPQLAADKKATYISSYNRQGSSSGWHFLTGAEPEITALADSVGFRYAWDKTTNQWAHASVVMILTPEGRISRYLYGIEYSKNDMRFSILQASKNKILNLTDQILLFCYHYDPAQGKYTFAIVNALRAAGTATALAIGLFIFFHVRRDRKREALKGI